MKRPFDGPAPDAGPDDLIVPEPEVAQLFDDFVLVPRADNPGFLPAVRAIVRSLLSEAVELHAAQS